MFIVFGIISYLLCLNGRFANAQCEGILNGVFVNNPDSCTGYFLCWFNEIALVGDCENNWGFNEAEQICDWRIDCSITVPPITEPTTEPTTGPTTEPTTAPPEATIECPKTGVAYLTRPFYCSSYFICRSGDKFEAYCAPGLHFDSNTLKCNLISEVNCLRNKCHIEHIDELEFIPGNACATTYYICDAGIPIQQSCADGLYWNEAVNQCTLLADIEGC